MTAEHKLDIRDGLRDSVPIAIGYFAVALALGITARQAGITPFQGFLSSFLNRTSTGEFAGYRLVLEQAPYVAMFVMTLIVNARYILMSAALSQRIPAGTPLWQRCIMAFGITDEIFGATILRNKPVSVWYSFCCATPAALGWPRATPPASCSATSCRTAWSSLWASRSTACSSPCSSRPRGRARSLRGSSSCPSR